MIKNISNVKYELISSADARFKEVQVLFTYQGRVEKYFVFIEDDGKKDWIKEAKKLFQRDLNNGQVAKVLKITPRKSHAPLLITSISIVAIAAIAVGGFFVYQYFNSGTSGGGTYKPGQEVEVNPEVNDPSGDYQVKFNNTKAVVGEEYNTTIDLIPQNPSTKTYYLPDKLVSVLSNTTILKEEQYTYTLDTTTKTFATLKVPAENVYGPIIVNLALVESGDEPKPGEIVDVIADVTDPTGGAYKVTYNDKDTPDRATVGKQYVTNLKLTKVGASDDDYTLPEKLSTVISGSSILKADEGYTYTLDETKMSATLTIPGASVKGKTLIDIDLAIVEPLPVIIGDPREPLTFVCTSNSGEIDIHHTASGTVPVRSDEPNLYYRVDEGGWQKVSDLESSSEEYTIKIKDGIKKGQKVQFKGTNVYWSYASYDSQNSKFNSELLTFVAKGNFVVGNNIMSLLDPDSVDFRNITDISDKSGCFAKLFGEDKNGIVDASGLWLQATTLDEYVYDGMFLGCESLQHAPTELPAASLEDCDCCYYQMFKGCKNLLDTPTLFIAKATSDNILPSSCCEEMFSGCASITEAPDICNQYTQLAGEYCFRAMFQGCVKLGNPSFDYLPATTLTKGCYQEMFEGCTSLTDLSENSFLPAQTLTDWCYSAMFRGCTSLVKAPSQISSNDATNGKLAKNCCEGMFLDCTSLTNAPTLPSTNLAVQCYESMFEGCTSLVNAPELPASQLKYIDEQGNEQWFTGCYQYMFSDCGNLKHVKVGFADDNGDFPGWVSVDEEYSLTEGWFSGAGEGTADRIFEWKGPAGFSENRSPSTIPGGWTVNHVD